MYLGRSCVDRHGSWVYVCRSYVHVPKISPGVQIGWKSRKTGLEVFCIFTPLYRRFRLSRAILTIQLIFLYRLVSKILNLTSYGSVLTRFSIDVR